MSLNKKQLTKDTRFANKQRKAPTGVKKTMPVIGPGFTSFQKPSSNLVNFHQGGYVHAHPHAEMPVSTFTQGTPSGQIYTDTEATLPDYASQAFFGNLQEEQKIQEALAEPGPTVNKANPIAKLQDKQRKKVERQIEAIESGDIDSYYSYIKGKEGRDKAIAEAEYLKAVAEADSYRPNGAWNNWGDAPVGHVAIAPWLLGINAAGQFGTAGLNALGRSTIGQATKAAFRTPLGKAAIFAPEAYFASDFAVNRTPGVAQDIYRGEADWDTATEAAMGALDLAGIGLFDNVTGAIGRGVRNIKDDILQSKAAKAFNVGDYRTRLGEEIVLTQNALNDLDLQYDDLGEQITKIKSRNRSEITDLKIKEGNIKERTPWKHIEEKRAEERQGEDIYYKEDPSSSAYITPKIDPTTGKPSEKGKLYIEKKNEIQRLERRYKALQQLKKLIDDKQIKILEDGSIQATNSNVYKELGTMKDKLSDGADSYIIDLDSKRKIPIEIDIPKSNTSYRLDNSDPFNIRIVSEIKDPTRLDYTVNKEYWEVLDKNKNYVTNKLKGSKPYGSSTYSDLGVVHATDDIDVVMTREDYINNVEPLLDSGEITTSSRKPRYGETVYIGNKQEVGNSGKIDVNIIEQNKEGFASGEFAQELYRQLYPQKFYDAQKTLSEKYIIEANDFYKSLDSNLSLAEKNSKMENFAVQFKNQNPLKLDVTPAQLMDSFDPVRKSIQDAYEATPRIGLTPGHLTITKKKHINKIDYLIENADPIKLKEGQEAFLKSLVGEKGSLGYQFSKSQLTDVDANLRLLDEIAPQAQNKAKIAEDPDRMQLVLNDFYINNSVYTREISIDPNSINNLEDLESAFLQWKQGKSVGGLNYGGGGPNVVRLGEPFHEHKMSTIKGQIQTKSYDLGKSYNTPQDYVKDVLKNSEGSRKFDEFEKEAIKGLMQKYGYSPGYNNDNVPLTLEDLITQGKFHTDERLVDFVKEASQELGFNAISRVLQTNPKITGQHNPTKGIYGTSQFAVLVNTSKDELQAFSFAFKNMVPKIKSNLERLENVGNHYSSNSLIPGIEDVDILSDNISFGMDKFKESLVQFNALEGYLKGGIESLEKRLLTNQDMEAAIARIVSSKGGKVDPSSLSYDELMQSKLKYERQSAEDILYNNTKSRERLKEGIENIKNLNQKEIDKIDEMQSKIKKENKQVQQALKDLKNQEQELSKYKEELVKLGIISTAAFGSAAGAYKISQQASDKSYSDIWEEKAKKQEDKKALNEIEIEKYRTGGMVIAPSKVMISKPFYEHGGLHLDSDTPMSAFGQRLAESRVSSTPKKKKTLKEQYLEESLRRQEEIAGISGTVDRGETLQNVAQTYVGGSDLGSAKDQKRATDAEIAAQKKAVAQKVYADMTKDSQYHQKNFSMTDAEKVVENMGDNWLQYYKDKGLGLREVDAIRDPGDDYNQSAWSRFGDYFWNPLDAVEYSFRTGDFRNMPRNYSAYEAGLAQTGESGFTDGNFLSKGLELATYAAPAGVLGNAIRGTRAARVMPAIYNKVTPYTQKVFNWMPNTHGASQKAYDAVKAVELALAKQLGNANRLLGRNDAFHKYKNFYDNLKNPYGRTSVLGDKARDFTGNALMNTALFWNSLPKQVLNNKFLTNAGLAFHLGSQAPLITNAIESGDPYDFALAAANAASLGSSARGYFNRSMNPYNTKYGTGLVRPEDLRMDASMSRYGYQHHKGMYKDWKLGHNPRSEELKGWVNEGMEKSKNFDPNFRTGQGDINLSWNEKMHAGKVAKNLWNNKAIRKKYEQIFGKQPNDWYDDQFFEFAAVEAAKQAPLETKYIGTPQADIRGKSKYSYVNFLTDQGTPPSALQAGKLWERHWGNFKHPSLWKSTDFKPRSYDAAERYSDYLQKEFQDAFQSQFPQNVLVNRLDNLDYEVPVNRNGKIVMIPIRELNPGDQFRLSQPWATSGPWSTTNLGSETVKGDLGNFGNYRVTIDAPKGTGFYSPLSNLPHYAHERELVLPQDSWIRVKDTQRSNMEKYNKKAVNPTTPAMRFEVVSPDEFAPELSTPANPAKEQALKELAEKDLGISDASSNKGLTTGPEWLKPSKEKLKQEYYVEHQLKKNNFFPTEDSFMKAIDEGEMVEITPEIDKTIGYRSRTQSKEDLINLSKTYASWPEFRNEKTIDAIYEGINAGKTMDMPIVLEFPNGSKRVFSGNTRMDVAFQKGQNPKVLLIKVPGKTQFRFGGQTLNRMDEGGTWHPHDQYGNHYAGTAGMNSGAAFFGTADRKAEQDLGPTVAKAKVLEAKNRAANKVLNTDDKTLLQKAAQPLLENISNLDTSEGYDTPVSSLLNALAGRTKYKPWVVGSPGGAESAALSAYFNVNPDRVNKFFEPSNYMPNAVQPKQFYEAHGEFIPGDFASYVNKYLKSPMYLRQQVDQIMRQEYPSEIPFNIIDPTKLPQAPTIPFTPKMTKEKYREQKEKDLRRIEIENLINLGKPWNDMVLGNYSVTPGFDSTRNLHYLQYHDINDYDTHPLGYVLDKTFGSPFDIAGRVYYKQHILKDDKNSPGDTINVKVPQSMIRGY